MQQANRKVRMNQSSFNKAKKSLSEKGRHIYPDSRNRHFQKSGKEEVKEFFFIQHEKYNTKNATRTQHVCTT